MVSTIKSVVNVSEGIKRECVAVKKNIIFLSTIFPFAKSRAVTPVKMSCHVSADNMHKVAVCASSTENFFTVQLVVQ